MPNSQNDARAYQFEVQYATLCCKSAFYLGILDLALLALKRGKDLAVLYWDDENAAGIPVIRPALEIMQSFVPECVHWDGKKTVNLASPDTWIAACLRAGFHRGSFCQMNHWIPVFSRQQMGEEFWSKRTTEVMNKFKKSYERTQARMKQDDSDSDDVYQASLQNLLRQLNAKSDFWTTLHAVGIHPEEVPADGDCCLWTAASLLAGPVVRVAFTSKESVLEMRKEMQAKNSSLMFIYCHRLSQAVQCCSVIKM